MAVRGCCGTSKGILVAADNKHSALNLQCSGSSNSVEGRCKMLGRCASVHPGYCCRRLGFSLSQILHAFQQPVLYPCRSIYCTGFGLSLSSSLASRRRGKERICGAFYHSMICKVSPCSCSWFGATLELLQVSCRTCTVCRSSLLACFCLRQIRH